MALDSDLLVPFLEFGRDFSGDESGRDEFISERGGLAKPESGSVLILFFTLISLLSVVAARLVAEVFGFMGEMSSCLIGVSSVSSFLGDGSGVCFWIAEVELLVTLLVAALAVLAVLDMVPLYKIPWPYDVQSSLERDERLIRRSG